ncbi:BCS1 N terminal-domain-containing protein [Catenaria anguillulae PL171]|uniref:BCS1 N terminal-domain-containing protein n=1 Tax=Catenaria anguillulae PL171 TaxID=765915 RepID=A0A1Y2HFC2_9FUNG|nr:BCS1 N terminal-domain-containing protein [Catenaria anguillulae PL171]
MTLSATILETLSSNPYFSAGFGLFGLGTAAAVVRKSSVHGLALARRRLLVTLEIPSKDKSYAWVLHWLTTLDRQSLTVSESHVRASWLNKWRPKSHQLSVETSFKQHDNGAATTQFALVPGIGTHWIQYRGAWMQISRQRDTKMLDLQNASPWETIQITTLRRDAGLFPSFLAEAKEHALTSQVGKTVIYTSYGPEWRPFGQPRKKRPLSSVVLNGDTADRVVQDVQRFLTNWKWYNERGIPYRRGYLLYGPPGSGKSSFIQAVAGELEYNICVLNLSERGLTDDRLNHLMTVLPSRSILLLEDADAAFNKRTQTAEAGFQSGVTFSGLLNALDGVAAAEERLIFMTTNHVEKLDPALIRPGRVDMKVLIDWPSSQQMRDLYVKFYGDDKREWADEFVRRVESRLQMWHAEGQMGERPSMAGLQGHFIFFRDHPWAAVEAVGLLFGEDPAAVAERVQKAMAVSPALNTMADGETVEEEVRVIQGGDVTDVKQ